jgi:hypothetical protein
MHNVLQNGLQECHSDLVDSIYGICHLNQFSRFIGRVPISLIDQIRNVLPSPCDHHVEACFIMELFTPWYHQDPETLVSEGLEHFKHFHDPHLQGMLSD